MGAAPRAVALTDKAHLYLQLFGGLREVSEGRYMSPRRAYYGARVRKRGICPVCKRNMALLDDGRVAVRHREFLPDGPKCAGYGQMALPLPGGES